MFSQKGILNSLENSILLEALKAKMNEENEEEID